MILKKINLILLPKVFQYLIIIFQKKNNRNQYYENRTF